MTSGFEKSGTVLTVHLPAELDHPASDEIRRESDRIIGHDYIKNMIFDFSETVFHILPPLFYHFSFQSRFIFTFWVYMKILLGKYP